MNIFMASNQASRPSRIKCKAKSLYSLQDNGISWVEHGVRLSQILHRNELTGEGSEALWEYSRDHFILPHVDTGEIIDG